MLRHALHIVLVLASIFVALPVTAAEAPADTALVRQTWKMLDYLAVDYSGAVSDGNVVSPAEFAEMREFAATTRKNIGGLPAQATQQDLLKQADVLEAAIS